MPPAPCADPARAAPTRSPGPRGRLSPHSPAFTALLGALVTMASFATDMGLPVLAGTAASLGVAPAAAALTLSVFMGGFAIGPLVFGPLSDRLGRRRVLLGGCAAFTVFGALAASAQTLPALLVWRVLMGIGAGTAQVLVLAIVRDLFEGAEARAKQSYVNLAAGVAPIVAPTLGVWIAVLGGWRAIYGALAGGGVLLLAAAWLLLAESAPARGGPLRLSRALGDYARVLREPLSVGHAAVVALSFGSLFAYVSGSSLVLIGVLGVSERTYGYLFASTALGLVAGAFASARLSARGVRASRLITAGLAVAAAVAVTLTGLAAAGRLTVPLLVALIIAGNVAQGMMRPNAVQAALEPVADIAGAASALLSGLQMLTGALASATAAALFDGRSAVAMTATMAVCATGALLVHFGVVRPAERRRRAARATSGSAAAGAGTPRAAA